MINGLIEDDYLRREKNIEGEKCCVSSLKVINFITVIYNNDNTLCNKLNILMNLYIN